MTPITTGTSGDLSAAWLRYPQHRRTEARVPAGGAPVGGAAPAAPEARFGDMLSELVRGTDASQKVSTRTTSALLSGQNVPVHQVMVASEEAAVSFQLMLEVRNRLLEGYHELMRMQV